MNEKSAFRNFVSDIAKGFTDNVHTAAIARIEKYDATVMKADITLMQSGEEIFDVPVSLLEAGEFIIRPPYTKGNLVIVVFSESSIDEVITTGEQKESRVTGKHNITDAMVIQGVKSFNKALPSDHAEDLVIAKKDFTSKVVLKKNGDVIIESNNQIYLGENATEGVPLGDQLKGWLDSHTHPTPNGESGAPSNPSPNPSEKVRVK